MTVSLPGGELEAAVELGAVDSRSVRLWVRQPDGHPVEAVLSVADHAPVSGSLTVSAETDWTGALVLALPADSPGSPFTCSVGNHCLRGRLSPLPSEHCGLVFGFGSCNRPFRETSQGELRKSAAVQIYPAMLADLQRKRADLLLLAGDQVYSDALPAVSVCERLSGDAWHPPPFEEALAAYRRLSRGYLGESGFRNLREAFPTYCIWDDGDIFDCWGSRLQKTPRDRRLFEAASCAYSEYQQARNPGAAISPPPYNYTFRYGDIGFLVLDLRGARDHEYGRLLGNVQWQEVRDYLAGADAASIQTMFVVASIPIAHVSRWMAKLFDRVPGNNGNAVRDRWCSAAFVESRDEMLQELTAWQIAVPGRQVVVLSGDVHCASAFTIRSRYGRGIIQQFTSSGMTTPDTLSQRMLNQLAVQQPNLFEPRYAFQRHFLSFLNNFGLVTAEPLESGGHRVTFTVRAWQPREQRLVTAGELVTMPDAN